MATAESPEVEKRVAEDPETSSATSAIVLVIVVLIVGAFTVEYGLQTLIWIETKYWASANPWIRDVPQALPAFTPAPAQVAPPSGNAKTSAKQPKAPAQIKLYDYEFTAPWPGNSTIKPGQTYSEVRFDAGQVIVFFDPAAQLKTILQMKTENTPDYQRLQSVFGDQTPDSDFALYKVAYDSAPTQVSPLMQRADALRVNGALLYKLGFGYETEPGIHALDLGKNHGFEFGDVASGRPAVLRVFDDRDNQFRFIFTAAAGSNAAITQNDINVAVQSLQPVPLLER